MALIHRWPLTENANDIVGGLNLTNNGTVAFSAEGASFNGSSQWLSGTKTMPASGSITAWVKCLSVDKIRSVLMVTDSSNSYSNGISISTKLNGYWNQNMLSGNTDVTSALYPSTSHVFVAVTANQSGTTTTIAVFRNGIKDGEGSGTVNVRNSVLAIGRWGSYNGHYFHGYIQDTRIYDHALTQSEISALYADGPVRTRISTPVILSTMPAALTRGFR